MSKEIFCKLAEELERDPTDDEMADAMAALIDGAPSQCYAVCQTSGSG